MKVRSTLIIVLAFVAIFAIAATPAKPVSKLHELDVIGGKWQCKGTSFAFGDMPKHEVTATVNGAWILNNKWLDVHYSEAKTKENPMPFEVRGFFTYDETAKKFELGSVENDGGYSVEESNGWDGDKIVFAGPNHMGGGAPVMNGRDTWTKKGANGLTYSFELEEKGAWKKLIEETCTR
jgi:hypothetical protein